MKKKNFTSQGKNTGRDKIIIMEKLYKTIEVAELFDVKEATVHYWRTLKKLPSSSRIPRQSFLYSLTDILNFIRKTHAGEYKNSSINVINALEKLNLQTEIILPPTKRLSSLSKYYVDKRKGKPTKKSIDVNFTPAVSTETTQEFIKRTSKFTVTEITILKAKNKMNRNDT